MVCVFQDEAVLYRAGVGVISTLYYFRGGHSRLGEDCECGERGEWEEGG